MQDQELMHGMGTAKGHNVMGGPVDKLGEYNFSHRGHILTVHVYLYEYRYRMDKVLPSHVHLNQYNQHGLLASLVSQKARKQLTPPPPVWLVWQKHAPNGEGEARHQVATVGPRLMQHPQRCSREVMLPIGRRSRESCTAETGAEPLRRILFKIVNASSESWIGSATWNNGARNGASCTAVHGASIGACGDAGPSGPVLVGMSLFVASHVLTAETIGSSAVGCLRQVKRRICSSQAVSGSGNLVSTDASHPPVHNRGPAADPTIAEA